MGQTIQSTWARTFLRVLGALYAAAGVALTVYLIATSWGYASAFDFFLGGILLSAVAFGMFLILYARSPQTRESSGVQARSHARSF